MSIKFATFNGRPTHVVISFSIAEVDAAAYTLSRAGLEKSAQALLDAVNMAAIQTSRELILPKEVLVELSDVFVEESKPLFLAKQEYHLEVGEVFNRLAEGNWAAFQRHIRCLADIRTRDL